MARNEKLQVGAPPRERMSKNDEMLYDLLEIVELELHDLDNIKLMIQAWKAVKNFDRERMWCIREVYKTHRQDPNRDFDELHRTLNDMFRHLQTTLPPKTKEIPK